MIPADQDARDAIAAALRIAYPMEPAMSEYVTQTELAAALRHVDTKIDNSIIRNRYWFVTGCLALIIGGGSGYTSLVSKLDRLNEALPVITQILDERRLWILHKDRRDDGQDGAIKTVVPGYQIPPPVDPPK